MILIENTLTWDDSFAIAKELRSQHPSIDLEDVSLGMIYQWAIELPGFADDPQLATENILLAIYREWYEEEVST